MGIGQAERSISDQIPAADQLGGQERRPPVGRAKQSVAAARITRSLGEELAGGTAEVRVGCEPGFLCVRRAKPTLAGRTESGTGTNRLST